MSDVTLRPATLADVPTFDRWDREPHVISATSDDPDAEKAFEDAYWPDEIAMQDEYYQYFIAELTLSGGGSRPVGAMQIIDPHKEKTHYWGEIERDLRAVDIWIGDEADLGGGYGEQMMRLAFRLCFAEPTVTAIVIDPLNSNARAHKFYQRLGFKPTHRQTFGDDDCLVHKLTRADWRKLFPGD
ncbi:MAG: GNAT family N-acetyltransferase [Hyphomonadaceae bacterium]|nr:GNAT family N-acetyltransferase [Hyphomonadaceae bacterium]